MTAGPLSGLRVLILRPERPGDPLAAGLTAAGAAVFSLPLLRIEPLAVDSAALARAAVADWIFVSRHAVRHGLAAATAAGLSAAGRLVCAVGAATAEVLRRDWGIAARYPVQPTTEGLLELPELRPVRGRALVIFRGSGGRDALLEALRARGVEAGGCEVYRQVAEPRWVDSVRAQLALPGPLIAVAHSGSVVRALHALLASSPIPLPPPPCLVPGARVAAIARALGFEPVVAADALAPEMERALRGWYTPAG
ncbi:MAG: uroporphyrinogen-III synthase [Pseudomonadota bacterium]